jgi:acetate---CoA ligase (ADP-forming)
VVIVGASSRQGTWSRAAFENLKSNQFQGNVYLVNPSRTELFGEPCYPSLKALPELPDHLVIGVPAAGVAPVIREGGETGARSATIYAAGFGEFEEGTLLEEDLKDAIEESGVRVCGPNCMGNIATPSGLVTLTTPVGFPLAEGPVAIVGQSGGVILFLHGALRSRGIGVNYALSTGNELDLSMADYVRHFSRDSEINVVACFVEAVRDLDDFLTACDDATATGTTVLLLKMGRSQEGRQAAGAHTGSLTGALAAFDAAVKGHGIVRVDTLEEIVEAIEFLAHAQRPQTDRMAAITYSGGLRGLLLESADRLGYRFPSLSPETIERLRELLPSATIGNPLDTAFVGITNPSAYFSCVEALRSDPNIDAVIAQERLPRDMENQHSHTYLAGLEAIAKDGRKPVAIFSMLPEGLTEYSLNIRSQFAHLPFLYTVDKAVSTVRAVALSRPLPKSQDGLATDGREGPGSGSLDEADSKALLARYGIPVLGHVVVHDPSEAANIADTIGYPVVIKGIAADVLHKSEAGLVRTGLGDHNAVAEAAYSVWASLEEHSTAEPRALMVAPHVQSGIETILGLQVDPEVGPVVMFGWGGVMVDLLDDVSFARAPLTFADARELIAQTKVGRILRGYRGGPSYDEEALILALVALGELGLGESQSVNSVDINPFLVRQAGSGAVALDALVVLNKASS